MTPSETLTLQETADRLGVHYMTVYRWVRTGLLPATKHDGAWQVRVEDADARADGARDGPGPAKTSRPRRRIDHGARLADRLLAADEGGATRLVDDALAGGVNAEDMCVDVIADAMRRVGDAWERGDASVGDEHQARVIASRLVAHLAPQLTRRGRKRPPIVLGSVSGEQHDLPVGLLAAALRGRGHSVIELGADSPPSAFADAVQHNKPVHAVGVYAARSNDAVIAETVRAVGNVAPDVPVVVGGAGIADADHAARLGGLPVHGDGHVALEALTAPHSTA